VSDEPDVEAAVLERVIFFSDAVFAIAITLLALDLRLPEATGRTDADLVRALGDLVPELAAFALSFAVIAAFWIGHMRTFRALVRTDPVLITLDLVFLAFIALLPFPTSVLAHEGNLATTAVFYGLFGLATACSSTLLWVYASRIGHLVGPWVTPRMATYITYRAATVPVVFALSIPIAIVFGANAAEATWVLSFPIQALITRRFRLDRTTEPAAESDGRRARRAKG
jgi:uncharacterized membrane protein